MHQKIKELTEKIQREGFEKASMEADEIIKKANNEADELIRDAETKAEAIISDAKKAAEENAGKIDAEVRLSSQQALVSLRKEISDLIVAGTVKEPVSKAFDDSQFIRKILETLVKNWDPCSDEADLKLLVSNEQFEEMDTYLKEKSGRIMNKGLELERYQGSGKGFEIQPGNGNYKINITDEAFEVFLKEHFKPRTLAFLYGENFQ